MLHKGIQWGLAIMAAIVVSGCVGPGGPRTGMAADIIPLYQSSVCGLKANAPSGIWIEDAASLSAFGAAYPGLCESGRAACKKVDFTKNGIFLISLGMRPTGGYDIRLAAPELVLEEDTSIIRVQVRRPSPEARVTQALTSPCLILQVPKGEFRHLLARDTTGQLLVKTRRN